MTTKKRTTRKKQDKHLSPKPDKLWAFELALSKHRARLEALPKEGLIPITTDPKLAAMVVIAAAPKIAEYRELLAKLPGGYAKMSDELESLARATWMAAQDDGRTKKKAITALAEGAQQLKKKLMRTARYLEAFGLIDDARLALVGRTPGYGALADDLTRLSNILRDSWPVVQKSSALTSEELEAAVELRNQLVTALAPNQIEEATDLRNQAYSDLKFKYDKLRKALEFLEVEEVEAIAPSWYRFRSPRALASSSEAASGVDTSATKPESESDSPTESDGAGDAAPASATPKAVVGATVVEAAAVSSGTTATASDVGTTPSSGGPKGPDAPAAPGSESVVAGESEVADAGEVAAPVSHAPVSTAPEGPELTGSTNGKENAHSC